MSVCAVCFVSLPKYKISLETLYEVIQFTPSDSQGLLRGLWLWITIRGLCGNIGKLEIKTWLAQSKALPGMLYLQPQFMNIFGVLVKII